MTNPREMSPRFNLLTDSRFEPLKNALRERMQSAANAITAETFQDVLDTTMRGVVGSAFTAAGAHEGSIWLAERGADNEVGALVAAYNTGPDASKLIGFRQHIGQGIISSVFAYEQPFCENQVYKNEKHDKTVDRSLGTVTVAMIAVPLYFAGTPRGIVSCVQRKPRDEASDPPGFPMDSIRHVQLAAEVLSRLIDHRLLSVTVGYQPE
jgi:hypothetical protein